MTGNLEIKNGVTLLATYKEKESELKELKKELDIFKATMMHQLEIAGLESIKKEGYSFTIVQPQKTVVDNVKARAEIVDSGKDLVKYLKMDTDRFKLDFFGSEAISKIDGTKYLKVTAPRVK